MHTILIVDDEPYVVNAVYRQLEQITDMDLILHKAYNGQEALQIMEVNKVDLVLSDIQMPGMTGLELQRVIAERWKRCKFIFLTGYNEFDYIQQALRVGSVNYVLKSEGYEVILGAIRDALLDLHHETQNEAFLAKARDQLRQALPALRKETVHRLLRQPIDSDELQNRMNEVDLPFNVSKPFELVIGKVDEWETGITLSDQSLFLFAIQNIADEILEERFHHLFIPETDSHFYWIIQPKSPSPASEGNDPSMVRYIAEEFHEIQSMCKSLLKVSVSFVYSSSLLGWGELAEKKEELRHLLILGQHDQFERLISDASTPEDRISVKAGLSNYLRLKQAEQLELALNERDEESFMQGLLEMNDIFKTQENEVFTEFYYQVATLLLSYMNKWGLWEQETLGLSLSSLMNIGAHSSRESAVSYLSEAAALIFRKFHKDAPQQDDRHVVMKVDSYIERHLDSDLSLTSIAEEVHLNPQYLCRLYKQLTGKRISNTISETRLSAAIRWLRDSDLKIHEIAKMVGLEPPYFAKYFKKEMHCTPLEYREKHLRH